MKNRGFSLVETLVVIAIIGIMSTIITPRMSFYLAKAKESKMLANLEVLRMASEMYYIEEGKPLGIKNGEIKEYLEKEDLEKLKIYFSGKIDLVEDEENIEIRQNIGGSREEKGGKIKLGGQIKYTYKNEFFTSNGINLWIKKDENMGNYSLNNYKWEEL